MKTFFALSELVEAKLPGLPRELSGLERLARVSWRGDARLAKRVPGRTKPFWVYHISLLPKPAQTRLMLLETAAGQTDTGAQDPERQALWRRYEALNAEHKEICRQRLAAIDAFDAMVSDGVSAAAACLVIAQTYGIAKSALYRLRASIAGLEPSDRLAGLAPCWRQEGVKSAFSEEAWQILKSDYLRPEKPSFSACYRRMVKLCAKKGWAPVPTERTARRRIEAEVPDVVRIVARDGRDKAKALYPAQRRTRDHLTAMQAVNMDGHRFDVFVRFDDGRIGRPMMVALQDLYSGKFLAWRLSESENKETVRLAIGDMVETFGIPDEITLDNGRAFTSKWISGGTPNRFRFKVKDEDPQGLLTTLGVRLSFTIPFSGQSKPIERAFRDLTDDISRHPFCAGAYTGNRPDAKPENHGERAIPIDDFKRHVDAQIDEHNRRSGRRGGTCRGRSFDETFQASIADPATIVRRATSAQRALWLLASEAFRARKPGGEIHLFGNRYWAPALIAHAGQKVILRFDPDRLTRPVLVYDLKYQLICEAPCIADQGFHDVEAARLHAKARGDWQKAVSAERDAHRKLTARELADLYGFEPAIGGSQATEPAAAQTKVVRMATGALLPVAAPRLEGADFENTFSRALARIADEPEVIPFPGLRRSAG